MEERAECFAMETTSCFVRFLGLFVVAFWSRWGGVGWLRLFIVVLLLSCINQTEIKTPSMVLCFQHLNKT